jgi:hypothetical protein
MDQRGIDIVDAVAQLLQLRRNLLRGGHGFSVNSVAEGHVSHSVSSPAHAGDPVNTGRSENITDGSVYWMPRIREA